MSSKLGGIADAEALNYFNLLAVLNSSLKKMELVSRGRIGLASSVPIPCKKTPNNPATKTNYSKSLSSFPFQGNG